MTTLKNLCLNAIGIVGLATSALVFSSCSNDDYHEPYVDPVPPTVDMSGFARGADVSWVTQMEQTGLKFYDAKGQQQECLSLLRDLGMNAIRLRVWVNPSDGWCNEADVLVKARRAQKLGYRIMIDFHYSDSWADPGQQIKPAAWQSLNLTDLKKAIADHTSHVLNALTAEGITPEWVQIGNEIRSGMLWDTNASLSGATWDATKDGVTYATNQSNFVAFLQAASAAVRTAVPSAKVIVHCDKGEDLGTLEWIADMVRSVDYDVFGVSLYPGSDAWVENVKACATNLASIHSNYGKQVMVCEVGMPVDAPTVAKAALTSLMTSCKAQAAYNLGVFYWEPECYSGWNYYNLGAFDNTGKPTVALDAFKAE